MSEFVKELTPQLIKWRREFHQYPELGFMEYVTTYKLAKELQQLGFQIHIGREAMDGVSRLGMPDEAQLAEQEKKALEAGVPEDWLAHMQGGFTGVVAEWDTGKSGDHFGFRFDIDALPIQEAAEETHLPSQENFSSDNAQTMHACGHDGHMTIGLGVASYIAAHHEQLEGKFTLLFQPAEEGGRGAKAMVEKGWLDDVDYFYSGHIGIKPLPVGHVAATVNGFLASAKFNVSFHGASSHAGMHPELGKNALLAAAAAATNLYAIPRHSDGVTRINVGKMTAGSGRNIIPEDAVLEVETRGETQKINSYMLTEAKRVVQAAALMHDVACEIDEVGVTEGITCDPELIDSIQSACTSAGFVKKVLPAADVSGSEDASFMINRVQQHGGKATYMLFGTELGHPHHHPAFDFQEEVLPVAVETFIRIIEGGASIE
ncbi:amidohydrolase [Lentibacillus sediminis]|uniref:amidohydrolase n=1 Tax=Lentibacillus sediminis TaxID=1940529 RepID=UPI000C1BC161|nr:amidohydrolase [Lentibacillus sediminis]